MRYVWRVLLIVAGLGALLIVGTLLFLQTAQFQQFLHGQIVSTLNTALPGKISLGGLEGSVWRGLHLTDLVVRYEEEEVVRIPRLTVGYTLRPLLNGQVSLTHVDVYGPVVRLTQDKAGNWNLVQALVPDTAQEADPSRGVGMSVFLSALTLYNATVELVLADHSLYRLHDMTLEARATLEGNQLQVVCDRFATGMTAASAPRLDLVASASVHGDLENLSIDIPHIDITSAQSRMRFTGQVADLDTLTLDGTLSIQKLAAADLAAIVPGWPIHEAVFGEVRVAGQLADLHTDIRLAVADAELKVNVRADLSQSEPKYTSSVAFSHFDLAQLRGNEALGGIFEGSLELAGQGVDMAGLTGNAVVQGQALRIGGWQVGEVGLTGSVKQQVGEVTGTIAARSGQANWNAEIQLADELAYTFTLAVDHLDLQKMVPGEEPGNGTPAKADTRPVMTSDLNLSGTVQGRGRDPSSMNARVLFTLAPSSLGPISIDSGRFDASVTDGRVDIADMHLKARSASLAVQGELGMTLAEMGKLSYQLNVSDLAPWLALADQKGTGQLTLAGEAEGNLTELTVSGATQTRAVALQGGTLTQGTIEYNLTRGELWPTGSIAVELVGLHAGVALQSVDAQLELMHEEAPSVQMTVQATDSTSRRQYLDARIVRRLDQLSMDVNALAFALPGGVWELVEPATVIQQTGAIAVEALQLRNGDQRISLDGYVSTHGAQDFQVWVEEFAIADLRPLVPAMPTVTGALSTHIRLSGTAETPIIEGCLSIDPLRIIEQPYKGLSSSFTYQDKQATLDLTFEQDEQHALQVSGTLPLALHWHSGLTTGILGDLDARARSSGLNLAFLNTLSGKGVSDIAGELHVDMALHGPPTDPFPQGTIGVRNGQVTVAPLGTTISDATLMLVARPEAIRIEEFSAVSGKGKITGQGAISLHDYAPQGIEGTLTAHQWPAIHTRQYQAEVSAAVKISGALTAPHLSGTVEVLRATLRPDLAFLDSRPVNRDETIRIVPVGETASSLAEQTVAREHRAENRAARNATIDLTVRVNRNTQIKHANTTVDLTGAVKVTKEHGAEPRLVGDIKVVQGWAGFQGRRFTLDGGKVQFTGGRKINPSLDIVAQYQAPAHVVEVVVQGTADEPTLVLRSKPELDHADILAVLLFGKPTSALEQGEKLDLEKQALAITSGYAATKIGESVSQALGLERLGAGLKLSNLDIAGGTVGFGFSLPKGLQVSVAHDLTKKGERKVSLEYQLSPNWQIDTSSSSGGASEAHILWQKKY